MQLGDFFEIQTGSAPGSTTEVTLTNRLFRLTVLSGEFKRGAATGGLIAGSGYPLDWRRGQTITFGFDTAQRPFQSLDGAQIRLTTAELGLITLGAETETNRLAALERPRSFFDFLRKEYEVNLLLDGDETTLRSAPLGFGVNLAEIDSDLDCPGWLGSDRTTPVPGLIETLRGLKPETLRFDYGRFPDAYLDLCRTVGAKPYLRVDAARLSDADFAESLDRLNRGIARRDFDSAYLEIDVRGFLGEDGDSAAVDRAAARIRSLSDRFRNEIADGKTVLGGVDAVRALASDRILLFFQNLLAVSAHSVDFVGADWLYPGPGGWDTDASDVDGAAIFAHGTERLARLTKKLFSDIPEPLTKPIVLTSWRYFRAPDDSARWGTADRRADGFYYVSVLEALSADARFRLQLMDLSALTRRGSNGAYEAGIGALSYRLTARREATRIGWRVVRDEPIPGAATAGIPGLADAFAVPDMTMWASRSTDRKRVFLILQNRHPKKRLYARVHFANLPDQRPVTARIIRAGTGGRLRRFFENDASLPTMKELEMPRYRAMDHVNLDIPAQGIVSMELSAD